MPSGGLGPLLASLMRLRARGDELLKESVALRQTLRESLADRRSMTEYRWLALGELRRAARLGTPPPGEH